MQADRLKEKDAFRILQAIDTPDRIALLAADAAQGDPTVAPAFAALIRELLASLRP
jgi:hypothetical protein